MESQEKCRTWVGNIYKKVGTFCSTIDNMTSQESFEYAEDQLLTAGANVKQFTENQLLTAGANVKQFYSDFMQEFLKDTSKEKIQSLEETEKCDPSASEILEKDDDDGHKYELSRSNSDDGDSASGPSAVTKEMRLEQNQRLVTLTPSDIYQVDAFEKNDIGMTRSVCGVDQSNDGRTEDQIDLQRSKPVPSPPSYSSAEAVGTAEPEDTKANSLNVHAYALLSTALDESKALDNEDSSSGIDLSKALDDSADDAIDGKARMNTSEPFDILIMNHQNCDTLPINKICSLSDLEVEDPAPQVMDNSPLKSDKGWEFIQTDVDSEKRRQKSPKQMIQPRESMSNKDDDDLCESDWEMV